MYLFYLKTKDTIYDIKCYTRIMLSKLFRLLYIVTLTILDIVKIVLCKILELTERITSIGFVIGCIILFLNIIDYFNFGYSIFASKDFKIIVFLIGSHMIVSIVNKVLESVCFA